jgi:cell division protease FtsH
MPKIKFSKPKTPRFTMKNVGASLLVLAILITVFSLFGAPTEKIPTVPLSQVATEVNAGKVKKISVEQNTINIEKTDGKKETAKKEADASLTDSLKNFGVNTEKLRGVEIAVKEPSGVGFWTANLLPALLPFLLLGGFMFFMIRSAQSANSRAISFGQIKDKPTGELPPKKKVTFKDVAGAHNAKQELMEVVDFLKNPKKFTAMGARIPKGVLLFGAPGTGKTLLAKAVAGEADVPFFHMSGSEFVEMFVGVGASRVRDLFQKAKENAPAIVFVDELDAVGRHRGTGMGGGHDEREQTLNQILVEMDGFATDEGVIVIAATNRPDVLDPALLRPGRFDRHVTLDLPDIDEREAILKVHSEGKPMVKEVSLRRVAERTPGFSGADLANLTNEAAILTVRREKKQVGMPELLDSIEKVMLGPERKNHMLSGKEKEIVAYHEAGHAIIAHVLPHVDPVRKISIVSRGRAGGYTLKLPETERRLHSKPEFLGELATLLGGYTAELTQFGELTTGASNDLKRATELARSIVTEYGMSDMGPTTYGEHEEYVFLGRDFSSKRNFSEETAFQIDKAIINLLDNAKKEALDIIAKNKDKWALIAKVLMEKETIEQDEFWALMGEAPKPDSSTTPPTPTATTPATEVPANPTPEPKIAPAGA